jgi:hypothetical protein
MSDSLLLGYSPNDFFYVDPRYSLKGNVNCNSIKPNKSIGSLGVLDLGGNVLLSADPEWNRICQNSDWFRDNSANCVNVELCKNEANANKLMDLGSTKLGSKEKYMNEKMNYDNILMNTINLGIGIVFLVFVIYKAQKKP